MAVAESADFGDFLGDNGELEEDVSFDYYGEAPLQQPAALEADPPEAVSGLSQLQVRQPAPVDAHLGSEIHHQQPQGTAGQSALESQPLVIGQPLAPLPAPAPPGWQQRSLTGRESQHVQQDPMQQFSNQRLISEPQRPQQQHAPSVHPDSQALPPTGLQQSGSGGPPEHGPSAARSAEFGMVQQANDGSWDVQQLKPQPDQPHWQPPHVQQQGHSAWEQPTPLQSDPHQHPPSWEQAQTLSYPQSDFHYWEQQQQQQQLQPPTGQPDQHLQQQWGVPPDSQTAPWQTGQDLGWQHRPGSDGQQQHGPQQEPRLSPPHSTALQGKHEPKAANSAALSSSALETADDNRAPSVAPAEHAAAGSAPDGAAVSRDGSLQGLADLDHHHSAAASAHGSGRTESGVIALDAMTLPAESGAAEGALLPAAAEAAAAPDAPAAAGSRSHGPFVAASPLLDGPRPMGWGGGSYDAKGTGDQSDIPPNGVPSRSAAVQQLSGDEQHSWAETRSQEHVPIQLDTQQQHLLPGQPEQRGAQGGEHWLPPPQQQQHHNHHYHADAWGHDHIRPATEHGGSQPVSNGQTPGGGEHAWGANGSSEAPPSCEEHSADVFGQHLNTQHHQHLPYQPDAHQQEHHYHQEQHGYRHQGGYQRLDYEQLGHEQEYLQSHLQSRQQQGSQVWQHQPGGESQQSGWGQLTSGFQQHGSHGFEPIPGQQVHKLSLLVHM